MEHDILMNNNYFFSNCPRVKGCSVWRGARGVHNASRMRDREL